MKQNKKVKSKETKTSNLTIVEDRAIRPIFSLNPKNIENILNFNELRIYIYLSRLQGLDLTKQLDKELLKTCYKYLNISLVTYLLSMKKLLDLELIYFDEENENIYLAYTREI